MHLSRSGSLVFGYGMPCCRLLPSTTVYKKREQMRIARFPVNRGKNVLCRLVSAGNDADGEGPVI